MTQLFKNNAVSALVGAISAADTVFNLANGELFPAPAAGDFFLLTLIRLDANGNESGWEIVKVTARTGNTLTVVRAQEGTSGQSWPDGTLADARLTAGSLGQLKASDSSMLGGVAPSQDALAHLGASGTFSFRNKIINGDMRINQRGPLAAGAAGYFVDRFYTYGLASCSITQTNLSEADVTVTGVPSAVIVSGGAGLFYVFTRLEAVRDYSNRTVTLSFYGKADAATVIQNIHIRQHFGTGGSPLVDIAPVQVNTAALSATMQRYTYTFNMPSTSGKTIGAGDHVEVYFQIDKKSGQNIYLTGFQLEAGSVATPFEHRPIGQELALCQRYFSAGHSGVSVKAGGSWGGTPIKFPVTMRARPTIIFTTSELTGDWGSYSLAVGPHHFSGSGTNANLASLEFAGYTADAEL
ncbi:hypothetical protein N7320_02160 [Stutzerimonas stutzeri]|uniref:hypothetical protein n=1 Tax=Stutzerimonas stutzeri TaxID=316 RepID=UPI00244A8AF1|nr:hypothetical protein [Stutzerimonas stutzeri]MDH0100118.1 hypothetical protein [Stutzerimonas stutzeri]